MSHCRHPASPVIYETANTRLWYSSDAKQAPHLVGIILVMEKA